MQHMVLPTKHVIAARHRSGGPNDFHMQQIRRRGTDGVDHILAAGGGLVGGAAGSRAERPRNGRTHARTHAAEPEQPHASHSRSHQSADGHRHCSRKAGLVCLLVPGRTRSKGLFRLGTKIFGVSHRMCRKDVGRGF